MATTTCLLVIRGDTRPAKEVLKKAGWTWNSVAQHWFMRIVTAHADRIRGGDTEFAHGSLKLNRKGCQVTLDGIIVWTSKTFVAATPEAPIGGDHGNCCDGHGNPVATKKIPGSAPDDRI